MALSNAMKKYDEIEEVELDDRLMDFIRWGCAVVRALGYDGDCFLNAYKKTVMESQRNRWQMTTLRTQSYVIRRNKLIFLGA